MNNSNLMTWQNFKNELSLHSEKHLEFQYSEDSLVDPSYHITEIKLAPITSVDCGGKMNKWTEVIVQIWEPSTKSKHRPMKVSKALSIVELVEKSLPLDPNAMVKIEFGNSEFDTRQMYPNSFLQSGDSLTINLEPDFTQCKAIGGDGSCGTREAAGAEAKKISASSCCQPESACCS